jgi:hypothetical protein
MTRSGQDVEDWLSRLNCLNVKRDRLRFGLIGDEVMNGCEDDMADWSSSSLQPAPDAYDLKIR